MAWVSPGDGIERFSVPEQQAGNARQRREYNSVVLVWVLDSRLNEKPPQEGRATSTTTSTISTTKASNVKNLKNLYCFTVFSFHQITNHCKTIEILEILDVYIQKH